jgi:hypothetical protein
MLKSGRGIPVARWGAKILFKIVNENQNRPAHFTVFNKKRMLLTERNAAGKDFTFGFPESFTKKSSFLTRYAHTKRT